MKANRILRKQRPVDRSNIRCDAFRQGGILEIAVPASRCCHDAEGGCIMCNYGVGVSDISREILESQFDAHVFAMGAELNTLILCTNGSFLDDRNVPFDVQQSFLVRAQNSAASTIIIETHFDTLLPHKLEFVRDCIPSKDVIFEIGLESADAFVQTNCYLKEIPLDQLSLLMKNMIGMGFQVQLNVILGAPFLAAREQMDDAEHTIRWGLEHGSIIALFPMNIKPFTLLQYAYSHGLYDSISHWAVPLLLERFLSEELEKIDLAWYGNRQISYEGQDVETVFPKDCEVCHRMLQDFYNSYVLSENGEYRHMLVKQVLSEGASSCSCMEKEICSLKPSLKPRERQVLELQNLLLAKLQQEGLVLDEV